MLIIYRLIAFLIFLYPFFLLLSYSERDSSSYYKVNVDWYQSAENNLRIKNRAINSYPHFSRNFFYNKNQLFYYTPEGLVLHKLNIDSKTLVAPDHKYYTVSPLIGNKIEFFNFTGEKLWSLDTYSIPFITPFKKNIVLMSSDNNAITVYDYNRNLILPQSYLGSLVTDYSICPNNDNIAFGNIEGDLHYFDQNFKSLFKTTYNESRYNYIKSVSCSASGEYVVALAGLYPEKKLVYDKTGQLLWSTVTELDRRTPTDMYVDDINQLIFDREPNGLKIVSLTDGEFIKTLPFSTAQLPVTKIVVASTTGWIVVGVNGTDNTLMVLNQELTPIWTTQYGNEELYYAETAIADDNLMIQVHTTSAIYNYQISLPQL